MCRVCCRAIRDFLVSTFAVERAWRDWDRTKQAMGILQQSVWGGYSEESVLIRLTMEEKMGR
ncbi:MAG: hypothetical protein KF753_23425 [Caldilineaceae bacterium]|nr:hypothetical protein [Caldilineaceae bacterium]